MRLARRSVTSYSSAVGINLLRSGPGFFNRLEELINSATNSIHLQTYILDPDETGMAVIRSLIKASERNVKVFILVDAYGSNRLNKKLIQQMSDAGVYFKWFEPILDFKNLSIGRRLHHKLAIFDSRTAIVGGINISNHYHGNPGERAWLDFAIEVKGAVVKLLEHRAFAVLGKRSRKKAKEVMLMPRHETEPSFPVRVLVNDWLKGKYDIVSSNRKAFRSSQSSILIVGSYFLPGRRTRNLLKAAASRNVRVRIILSHLSDVPMVSAATRHFYSWMLLNKIEIYEWKHSVLHGKAAIIDESLVTIGSFNFNFLSAFESIELNLELINKEFAGEFTTILEDIIQNDCLFIQAESYQKNDTFIRKLTNRISYQIVRYLMRFPLLFVKQTKEQKRKWL